MTPYEAIKTGTVYADECLGELDKFGTIAIGKRADLIFVENNPIEDISNIKNQVGVMIRGKWMDKEEMHAMFEKLK
ncbi:MAG: amidohydrolase family protein [Candidatus Marinimicrobia bacterium]|nr:amidohydrolase family protein [Candidatus Neomarinimicrobiota bacterium]